MAWATMHFATGMVSAGAIATVGCLVTRRGWRYVPVAMTLGGIWAMVPDMPRLFRVDFTGLPLAGLLGAKSLEDSLHKWGDLFFFHHALDAQPKEYALAGFALIVFLYNLVLLIALYATRRQRRRHFGANQPVPISRPQPTTFSEDLYKGQPPAADAALTSPTTQPQSHLQEPHESDPVIYRIRPEPHSRAE